MVIGVLQQEFLRKFEAFFLTATPLLIMFRADNKTPSFVIDQRTSQGVTNDWVTFFMSSKYAILLDGGFVTKKLQTKLGHFLLPMMWFKNARVLKNPRIWPIEIC